MQREMIINLIVLLFITPDQRVEQEGCQTTEAEHDQAMACGLWSYVDVVVITILG